MITILMKLERDKLADHPSDSHDVGEWKGIKLIITITPLVSEGADNLMPSEGEVTDVSYCSSNTGQRKKIPSSEI